MDHDLPNNYEEQFCTQLTAPFFTIVNILSILLKDLNNISRGKFDGKYGYCDCFVQCDAIRWEHFCDVVSESVNKTSKKTITKYIKSNVFVILLCKFSFFKTLKICF